MPNKVYNFGYVGNLGQATRDQYQQGIHYSALASKNVTWEVATKQDVGIDLAMFHNTFSLTVDYFHEKRTGIYMQRNFLPGILGLEQSPWGNVGAVKSEGFDGNFRYEDRFGDVVLTVRGNMTYSKNTILDYDVENNVYPYQYQTGYRVDQVRGLVGQTLFTTATLWPSAPPPAPTSSTVWVCRCCGRDSTSTFTSRVRANRA